MYSSILWATDGSPESDAALHEALELLEPGGRLVAFHCSQHFRAGRIGGEPVAVDEVDRLHHVDTQVDELRRSGIDVTRLVETTEQEPARQIAAFADRLGVQAIVCGTRGLHGLSALLDGSVAARLVRRSAVPVVVVPARARVSVPATASVCHPDAAAV
jgi:nucleotide-binding universal stress UspA family protein